MQDYAFEMAEKNVRNVRRATRQKFNRVGNVEGLVRGQHD